MTDYVLDVSKWRCGSDNGIDKLGEGDTALLNDYGYMCCLGQFAKHVGVPEKHLLNEAVPKMLAFNLDVAGEDKGIYDPAFVTTLVPGDINNRPKQLFVDTQLSEDLMSINDNASTTHQDKIEAIRKALEAKGHTLTVINLPTE